MLKILEKQGTNEKLENFLIAQTPAKDVKGISQKVQIIQSAPKSDFRATVRNLHISMSKSNSEEKANKNSDTLNNVNIQSDYYSIQPLAFTEQNDNSFALRKESSIMISNTE